MRIFFDFHGLPGSLDDQADSFFSQAKNNGDKWVEDRVREFVEFYKKRVNVDKDLSAGTLGNYFMTIKLYCEINELDTTIKWKNITRGMPKIRSKANDRCPTVEELRKLVKYRDYRIESIVYVMCSSGIRIQAWDWLKWKHVQPIIKKDEEKKNGEEIIQAAELTVYDGEPEQYFTFISAEAYHALKEWMDLRASYGENITGESCLMRDLWPMTNVRKDSKRGLATNPKQLQETGISEVLQQGYEEQDLRQPLPEGVRRHPFKLSHGFRKFFDTRALSAGMTPLNVALLESHDTGISQSYFRPSKQELLEAYLKIVDNLVINRDQKVATQWQKTVSELTEKSEHENYAILSKLAEKEKETENVKKQLEELQKQQQNMIQFFNTNMEIMVRNTIAQELDETTKKEKPGIKKLTERGNYAAHWGASYGDDGGGAAAVKKARATTLKEENSKYN